MTIPVLDLKKQSQSIKPEIDAAIAGVLESSEFILGPRVRIFEGCIAACCGCSHGVGVASGTDALLLALLAAGVGPGDEVITSPFTFDATGNTINRCGARPVFVDVEPDTLNIEITQVEQAVTAQTKAIIPVDLFGHPANMTPLMEIAERHGIAVIEDAGQAIGACCDGRRIGSFGVAGCLSFYPTKNLGAYGDAGMVVTNDPAIAEQIDLLRRQGSRAKYYADILGFNSRLDSIQAAILDVKLRILMDGPMAEGASRASTTGCCQGCRSICRSRSRMPITFTTSTRFRPTGGTSWPLISNRLELEPWCLTRFRCTDKSSTRGMIINRSRSRSGTPSACSPFPCTRN